MMDKHTQKTISCLIGGALGDALGRPVERLRTPQLYDYYGKDGIQDLQTVGGKARITVAAVTGNIMGAYLGINKLPNKFIKPLQLKNLILEMAEKP